MGIIVSGNRVRGFALFMAATILSLNCHADELVLEASPRSTQEVASDDGHSTLYRVAMYLPNRIFDLMDIFRLRVRVGPGLSAGVRATKVAQLYLGSHAAVYAGLPGPRRSPSIPLPIGLESNTGIAVSVLDATVGGGVGPEYSPTEFGVSLHPVVVGVDIGIDPAEILDGVAGIVGFDPLKDDF